MYLFPAVDFGRRYFFEAAMENANIPNIDLADFDYELPSSRIAAYPASERSGAKLLFVDVGNRKIKNLQFSILPELIPENSLLVLNSTKVVPARLPMKKQSGGRAEILPVKPVSPSPDPQKAITSRGRCVWECLVGGKRIKSGAELAHEDSPESLSAKILEKSGANAVVEFVWDDSKYFSEVLDELGKTPLPPYIKRDSEPGDKTRYQTIYAKIEGSVAAPTAGLHFTDKILSDIRKRAVDIAELTLHVGIGTFMPIKGENVAKHEMHSERIFVDLPTLKRTYLQILEEKPVIAVGTTSVRTLESIYWHGVKLYNEKKVAAGELNLEQWAPYKIYKNVLTPEESLEYIIDRLEAENSDGIGGETSLFIAPGCDFKIANGIVTNFHIPKSTLILLVAAFAGHDLWRESYENALAYNYRFLSYGDSSFYLKF